MRHLREQVVRFVCFHTLVHSNPCCPVHLKELAERQKVEPKEARTLAAWDVGWHKLVTLLGASMEVDGMASWKTIFLYKQGIFLHPFPGRGTPAFEGLLSWEQQGHLKKSLWIQIQMILSSLSPFCFASIFFQSLSSSDAFRWSWFNKFENLLCSFHCSVIQQLRCTSAVNVRFRCQEREVTVQRRQERHRSSWWVRDSWKC